MADSTLKSDIGVRYAALLKCTGEVHFIRPAGKKSRTQTPKFEYLA